MTLLQLLFLLFISPSLSLVLAPANVSFRNGKTSDEAIIALTLAKELMNPLGVKAERFVVAVDETNPYKPIGWAQVRPLGTAQGDPSSFTAKPGSFNVESDADDTMWQEFEEDETAVVPVGLASLPWTKEYRAFSEAAKKRRERRALLVERERATMPMNFELASVYVLPDYRGQGIGKELIKRVLQRHTNRGRSISDVYLLTLATTVDWYYSNFGFEPVPEEDVPQQMAFEIAAGKLVTKLIGAKLCCMRGVVD